MQCLARKYPGNVTWSNNILSFQNIQREIFAEQYFPIKFKVGSDLGLEDTNSRDIGSSQMHLQENSLILV